MIFRYLILTIYILLTSFNFENQQNISCNQDIVNIGLLISEPVLKSEIAAAAVNAVELAINQANSENSQKNLRYNLIIKSCDGPWGAGSKAAVDLVFQDKVCAIITSLDGRNGHLAEQVIAKTKVAMVATRETDPTLTQAFVPWYFRCIPDDRQQADALTNEIFIKGKKNKTVVIYDDSYDSKMSADNFIKKLISSGASNPIQIVFNTFQPEYNAVINKIEESGCKDIALFSQPQHSLKILQMAEDKGMNLYFFTTLPSLGEGKTLMNLVKHQDLFAMSFNYWFSNNNSFKEKYIETYGYQPGSSAAYAFDGTNIIIQAVKKVGSDREKVIDELKKTNYNGVTGNIRFDEKGNRICTKN